MIFDTSGYSRRVFLAGLAALTASRLAEPQAATPDADHGPVRPPVPMPDLELTLEDGSRSTLPRLVENHATALQVMFTGCTTSCPMQGAIFHQAQQLIPNQASRGIQLVSLSVDPANDTPKSMDAWLRRFDAAPGWVGAIPRIKDLDRVKAFFGVSSTLDSHSTRVSIINRRGMLIWRTFELPPAEEIAGMLQKMG